MTLMSLLLTVDTDFVEVAGVSQRDAFGSQGDAFGKNPRPKLSFNISGWWKVFFQERRPV